MMFLVFGTMSARAQDRYFARTYTTNVLPSGNVDLEIWHTSRFGHEGQYFHAMDQRMEFEVGLGGRLQTAFYLNRYQVSASDSTGSIAQSSEIGFSNEWKWKLTRPTSQTGVALYGELGVKGDELEWESKIIVDRNFGKNLLAFNAVYELEAEAKWENGRNKFEVENTPLEFDLGWMYNFSPSLGAGLEIRNLNQLSDGSWKYSLLSAGPTINYRGNNWFVILNYLPQLRNLHTTASDPGKRVLTEQERAEARILFGFSLK